ARLAGRPPHFLRKSGRNYRTLVLPNTLVAGVGTGVIRVLRIAGDFSAGRVERLPVGGVTALHWMLRIACAMCFVGHGAWGIITKAGWLPLYAVFGVPESVAWHTMPLIGALDVTMAIAVLIHPCRALLVWMALWAVFTALLRPLAGMGWW